MRRIRYLVFGAAAGGLAVYLLDPDRGRSRRSELVQRGGGIARRIQRKGERSVRYAASQAEGLQQKASHRTVEDQSPTDERLRERVHSQLFRDPNLPKGDLNINVEHGKVVLRGHVADEEMRRRVEAEARRIDGVDAIENLIRISG
ncbi:MAG: BON domain-containing protein [Chloroflexi bacterium]|nr:MAG: BON domain-containing protein [Chloroflexota bacterium]